MHPAAPLGSNRYACHAPHYARLRMPWRCLPVRPAWTPRHNLQLHLVPNLLQSLSLVLQPGSCPSPPFAAPHARHFSTNESFLPAEYWTETPPSEATACPRAPQSCSAPSRCTTAPRTGPAPTSSCLSASSTGRASRRLLMLVSCKPGRLPTCLPLCPCLVWPILPGACGSQHRWHICP